MGSRSERLPPHKTLRLRLRHCHESLALGVTELRRTLEQFAKDTRTSNFLGGVQSGTDTYTPQAFRSYNYNGHLLWLLSRHLHLAIVRMKDTPQERGPPPCRHPRGFSAQTCAGSCKHMQAARLPPLESHSPLARHLI
eukprot:scaffold2214_cov128-Isochrysis_galbana.AAC.10